MKAIPVSFRRYYVAASIALAAVLALAIAWVWLTHGWRRPEESPPVPAHLIAYEQMRRLVEDRLVEHGRIEEYYVRLSDICRHYLENRFNLRAPERTTEEFLVEVSGTALLTGPQKGLVRDFLGHCDLVKFARYGPDDREMREAFEAAKRLVDETREDTEEEEPQAAPPAVASVDPQTSG
jgi:hypothetical protein